MHHIERTLHSKYGLIAYSQQLTTGNELKPLNKLTANVKGYHRNL